jgi:uncharacterized protein YpmS
MKKKLMIIAVSLLIVASVIVAIVLVNCSDKNSNKTKTENSTISSTDVTTVLSDSERNTDSDDIKNPNR